MKFHVDTISGLWTGRDNAHQLLVNLVDDSGVSVSVWLNINWNEIKFMTVGQIEDMALLKLENI